MKLDFATLAFGYKVQSGGNTPNWATALGQGAGHKINNTPEIDEIIKGMLYSGVPVAYTKTKIGKGGNMVSGATPNTPISLAAVFNRVFVNDTIIANGRFVLLITKDQTGAHAGRFKLKYSPSNTYDDGTNTFDNQIFFDQVKAQLGLADNACWFVSDINIRNQNELIFKTYIVEKNGPVTYADGHSLHEAWSVAAPFLAPYKGGDDKELKTGENIILYGVPGCGKSHKIKTEYCDNENVMERVVFHPDYTYSDFVGQILPENINGHISYPFVPGPFTRILRKAVDDPNYNYYLIIEELNRGNAPAIFGEVFQLLDRIDGVSEYGINNADIARAVYDNPRHPVRLPKNLFILATMNTADQNVFTLDTAFKRRWRMVSVTSDMSKCSLANTAIGDTGVTWNAFLDTVNPMIIECGEGNIGSEDKRIGAYFVQLFELQKRDYFAEKVLMYLWNDAFKYDHEKIFNTEYKTLEELIDGFKENGFDVFADGVKFKTALKTPVTGSENPVETVTPIEGDRDD